MINAPPAITLPRSAFTQRALVLIALFALAAILLASIGQPSAPAAPRWPPALESYAVDDWNVSQASIDASRPGLAFVSRRYSRSDREPAELVIATSPAAKAVYRAGASVPYLGNGFTVEAPPPAIQAASGSYESFVARRADEAWLTIATYGERRGQLGNGALGWALVVFDSLLGRANDYYLARVVVAFRETDVESALSATQLTGSLFLRLAAAYAG